MGFYKTTKKDLSKFKSYFQAMQSNFSLSGWKINFVRGNLVSASATVDVWLEPRYATVTLCSYFKKPLKDKHIKFYAEHECLELLFSRYNFLAVSRYTTELGLNESRHEIIQILQPLLTID